MVSLGSLWAGFTGDAQKKAARTGAAQANAFAQQGYNTALPTLSNSYGAAKGSLTGGYDAASQRVEDNQRRAHEVMNAGSTEQSGLVREGYSKAIGASGGALSKISELYKPYMESGRKAQSLYDQSMGINGADAQRQFYDTYASHDPMRDFKNEQINRAVAMQANAAGGMGSGRAGLAATRALNESYNSDINAYLNRLEGMAGRGGQYTSQVAGYTDAAAAREAQLQAQQGQALAGISAAHHNTLANMYANDPRAQYAMSTGQNMANLQSQEGSSLANLAMNYYGTRAGNAVNEQAAIANASGLLGNNLLNAAATAAQIYTGMRTPRASTGSAFTPEQQRQLNGYF